MNDLVDGAELLVKHFRIQKEQRRERLILRRCTHGLLRSQTREECSHFGSAHLSGMPSVVKDDESTHPRRVGLNGTRAIVAKSKCLAKTEQERWLRLPGFPRSEP